MAKKSAAKKKSTTNRASTKKSNAACIGPVGVYREKCPEDHVATGKYKTLFVLLSIALVIFAALAVQLFIAITDLENKYESIKTCARNHSSCEVRVNDTEEE